MTDKPMTGRKVFFIFASFFAVIITVNLTMAYQAISTFPGLETRNTYVASQSFDEKRAAQEALGWDVEAVIQADTLTLTINDSNGKPVQIAELNATLGRATHVKNDFSPEFIFNGKAYIAPVEVGTGNWNLRMTAMAENGTQFIRRIVIYVGK